LPEFVRPRFDLPGWLVTRIERVKNEDGDEAIMLDLEWGIAWLHQPDHTNAQTWCWADDALFSVLCREDGTPLTVSEAYGLEAL
jgi:hypothetical protein